MASALPVIRYGVVCSVHGDKLSTPGIIGSDEGQMNGCGFVVVPPVPTFLLLTPYSLAANGVGGGKTVPRIRHERPHFFVQLEKASLEKHKEVDLLPRRGILAC